jgi:hypothetical protein
MRYLIAWGYFFRSGARAVAVVNPFFRAAKSKLSEVWTAGARVLPTNGGYDEPAYYQCAPLIAVGLAQSLRPSGYVLHFGHFIVDRVPGRVSGN